MLLQSVILLFIGAAFMLLAVRRLRNQTLKERHALVFMISALPMFILAIRPSLLDWLVEWTGISASTIILMGVCIFFIYMILELLSLISKLDQRVSILTQTIGIQNERQQVLVRRDDQRKRFDQSDAENRLSPTPAND